MTTQTESAALNTAQILNIIEGLILAGHRVDARILAGARFQTQCDDGQWVTHGIALYPNGAGVAIAYFLAG